MTSLWFDDNVDQILGGLAKGEADRKLPVMTTTIISIAAEWFGEVEKKISGTTYSMNQRAVRIHNIRWESAEIPVQGGRTRGTHWPCPANVHPTEDDQSSPPGRVASEVAARESTQTCCFHH